MSFGPDWKTGLDLFIKIAGIALKWVQELDALVRGRPFEGEPQCMKLTFICSKIYSSLCSPFMVFLDSGSGCF